MSFGTGSQEFYDVANKNINILSAQNSGIYDPRQYESVQVGGGGKKIRKYRTVGNRKFFIRRSRKYGKLGNKKSVKNKTRRYNK
jgi:hypothetical protein